MMPVLKGCAVIEVFLRVNRIPSVVVHTINKWEGFGHGAVTQVCPLKMESVECIFRGEILDLIYVRVLKYFCANLIGLITQNYFLLLC